MIIRCVVITYVLLRVSPVLAWTNDNESHLKFRWTESIFYTCRMTHHLLPKNSNADIFYGNCDANSAVSGNFPFIREIDDKLAQPKMFIQVDKIKFKTESANRQNRNHTIAVATNVNFANLMSRPNNLLYFDLVGVIGEDDRALLSKNQKKIQFSSKEREQALRCAGLIYCPGGRGINKMQSAGAICAPGERNADGRCAADRVASTGHLFIDENIKKFIQKLDQCEFSNYRGHISKLIVDDFKIFDPMIDAYHPRKNARADKIVVRLKRPIPGCDPYDLDESFEGPRVGSELIALTHPQEDQQNIYDGTEPLAYPCRITRTFSGRGGGPALHYSDCDVNGVGSGGFALIRNGQNKLAVTSLFRGSGPVSQNGMPYSESSDPSIKNFTLSVGVNGDFPELASKPGVRSILYLTK